MSTSKAPANPLNKAPIGARSARVERGIVLPVALILLLVLTLSTVGFIRLIDTSALLARGSSFQRDAINRNELAMNVAMRQFENAPTSHFALLANTDQTALGIPSGLAYSATALPTDSAGVPLVLKDDTAFAAAFAPVLATTVIPSGERMTTRLVIDRLCSLELPADASHCAIGSMRVPDQCSRCSSTASPVVSVFRVTARTDGPRGIQAYSQMMLSIPLE